MRYLLVEGEQTSRKEVEGAFQSVDEDMSGTHMDGDASRRFVQGYQNIKVLDVSQTAIDVTRKRLGAAARYIHWVVADITQIELDPCSYDVWHDRAVFHFLTSVEQRIAYVRQVAHAVKRGGHVIVSTFGPEGPKQCSGLDVVRYDANSLHGQFGSRFRLVKSSEELHQTPFRTIQQFLYCYCMVFTRPTPSGQTCPCQFSGTAQCGRSFPAWKR